MSSALTRWHKLPKKAQWPIAIVVILVFLSIIGGLMGDNKETAAPAVSPPAASPPPAPTPPPPVAPSPPSAPSLSSGQENAVAKAEDYLDYSAFSRTGLIKQLKYEGFSLADATYAVDHVVVNWNEQAAKKAADYLDYSSFSRSGLMDQLLYEGFTQTQAAYGVSMAY